MQPVINAYLWVAHVVVVIVGFVYVGLVWLVTAPFDSGRYAAGRAFRHLAVAASWLNPYWKFRTDGVRIADPRRPYVAVSNHESYADIFLISHLPWEMKWMAKDTIFKIPVMGWMMRMAGDIPITRGSRDSAVQAIAAGRDRLMKKVSVMIFPEGTRSSGVEMRAFKDGAFRLAMETGRPVVPVAIDGTGRSLPKHGLILREPMDARVEVLEPLDTRAYPSVDALRDAARARIEDALRVRARTTDLGQAV